MSPALKDTLNICNVVVGRKDDGDDITVWWRKIGGRIFLVHELTEVMDFPPQNRPSQRMLLCHMIQQAGTGQT